MSELKKAMKENVPVIKASKKPAKVSYTGKQPHDDYANLYKNAPLTYKSVFGNKK